MTGEGFDDPHGTERIRRSYDAVAGRYVASITPVDEKPFECERLDTFLEGLPDGRIADLGCGPGDVTRYLRRRRGDVTGIDLSPGMIAQARVADPGGLYEVGDLSALATLGPFAGITAFYSLIHLDPPLVPAVLASWLAVLMPGGRVLIAIHMGGATIHLDDFLGSEVDLDFYFFDAAMLHAELEAAGFRDVRTWTRQPYAEIEAPTVRLYAQAIRPR